MYSQIESAQARGSAGLGIGLALVRTLVELHGGCVDVASDGPNLGSVFTVRLPLATGLVGAQTTAGNRLVTPRNPFEYWWLTTCAPCGSSPQNYWRNLGHEVRAAENGVEALKLLDTFRPDVVFSDITMQVMGGHELARRIRSRRDLDNVWLVALTGYGQSTDRELAYESGFDRHVTKPIDFQRLQELLDELD